MKTIRKTIKKKIRKTKALNFAFSRDTATPDSVGIFDIGSNSVRFVAYDLAHYPPHPFFNEKVICSLGRTLEKNGRLCKKGAAKTMTVLSAFLTLAEALEVADIRAIATAAVRDASDGTAFIDTVRAEQGLDIRILSGEQEALYSAYGVIAAFPGAHGIIADLGGGSLELAAIHNNRVADCLSLPLGVLRLAAHGKTAHEYIDAQLQPHTSPYEKPGALYAIGGTWRAFADALQIYNGIASPHSHGHEIAAIDAITLAQKLKREKPSALVKQYGIEKKRAKLLPYAALMLERLLTATQAETVVFSNAGLRDGIVYEMLQSQRPE